MNRGTKRQFVRVAGLILLALFFAPVFLTLQATPAWACSCIARIPLQHLASADVAFAGRLTRIDGPGPSLSYSSFDPVTYQFEVDTVLKGAVPLDARVRSVVSGTSCGLERMNEGERYTVFARTEGGMLLSGLCDGTHSGGPDPALALVSGVFLAPMPGAPPWWVLFLIVIAAILAWTVGMRARTALRNSRRR
jgi:hypothetical protein